MNAPTFLALAGILAAFYFAVTSVVVSRRVRKVKRELRIERIRSKFAEAREIMYSLAREGKLSPNSSTFRAFVFAQTFILRRPEEYDAIARMFTNELLKPGASMVPEPWGPEIERWPAEMKDVISRMIDGTTYLLLASGKGRLVYLVGTRILPFLAGHLTRRLYGKLTGFFKQVLRTSPERSLFAAMYRMEHLTFRH